MKVANRVSILKPSAIRAAGKLIAAKEGCISFAAGFPSPALMPVEEITVITDKILKEQGRVALQYGLTKGNNALIGEVVKMLAKKGIQATPAQIQITTGSQQGIFLSGLLTLNPGDFVAVENPTYLGAMSSYTLCECNYVGIEADEEGMDMEALEEALKTNDKIKLVYCVPNFSNPTGKTWSLARRKQLLALAEKYDFLIVEDDPYGDIRFDGEAVASMASMDKTGRVIYLGSFSKVLFAGLRVGFTVSSPEIADKFEVFKQGVDLQTNEFAQLQIAEYLKKHDLEKQVQHIVETYRKKRDLMASIIDEKFPKSVKRTHPQGGMFVWLELPKGVDASGLLEKCIDEISVGFVPGGPFFPKGHENTIRLNFSTVDEDKIVAGMNRLAEFLCKELG